MIALDEARSATGLLGDLGAAAAMVIAQARASVVQVQSGGRGLGAGVIWRADGTVLTNYHVVAREHRAARAPIQVIVPDGRTFEAQVVEQSPERDLALLAIDPVELSGQNAGMGAPLPVAQVGDSRRLQVGELIFAVGHPWGQRGIVTAGIVSGWGRAILRQADSRYGTMPAARADADQADQADQEVPYILSDVRLAPGNSGGPLVNAWGMVVGINTMIQGGDMAVAIPSHVVAEWVAAPEPVL